MRTIIVALFAVAILFFAAGATAQTPAVQTDLDPAVLAYTTAIKHLDLNVPLDRRLVTGFMDQLVSATEGLAIGREVKDEQFFARIRRERQALRRFANMPLAEQGREQKGHQLFNGTAQLLRDLDRKLGPNSNAKAAIEAVDRSARSLNSEAPLRWQPDNVEQFLRLGGEALRELNDVPRAPPRR